MTSRARALARAAREAEAERLRREAERRARRRAILTAPWRAVRRVAGIHPAEPRRRGLFRRGRTGKLRTRRDRAQVAAIVMGLLVALVIVFVTIDSWALRIGAAVLALLLAPVLLALTRTDYSRSVHRS
ncbi:hypothetical protein [Cryptosporangium minutisporangium]|uniref:DUF3040 domain-containing protein n=1 Tax=Cryptosporangium minutisporangium TaxID=113569 RepID=A0ABP6T085_9ACTN